MTVTSNNLFSESCDRPGCERRTDATVPYCCHPCRVAHHFELPGARHGDHADVCQSRHKNGEITHRKGETHGCAGLKCEALIPLDRKYCCNPCREFKRNARGGAATFPIVRHGANCPAFPHQERSHG